MWHILSSLSFKSRFHSSFQYLAALRCEIKCFGFPSMSFSHQLVLLNLEEQWGWQDVLQLFSSAHRLSMGLRSWSVIWHCVLKNASRRTWKTQVQASTFWIVSWDVASIFFPHSSDYSKSTNPSCSNPLHDAATPIGGGILTSPFLLLQWPPGPKFNLNLIRPQVSKILKLCLHWYCIYKL